MNSVTTDSALAGARKLAASVLTQGFELTDLYAYQNADGSIWCWRIRCDHPDGKREKWIRPMCSNANGYWFGEPQAPTAGKPLYRLPELLAARPSAPVLVVEGEKCADALARLGLAVTTSGGSGSADSADWTPLRGRTVLLWPDNDQAGTNYADQVRAKLALHGVAFKTVDVGKLELLSKQDCVDWLLHHPDATDADVLQLSVVSAPAQDGVELIRAADLKPESIRWLWPEWLARGKLHVLAGAPGTGKTTIAMDWAACISSGRALPSGWCPPRGNVLIWSGEDSTTDTLLPRLIAAGADLNRVHFVGEVRERGECHPFDPACNIRQLAAVAAGVGDIALIVVDPLVSAISGDSHKNAEVRRGLAPLVDFATQLDAALLGISHYSKGTQGREPLERVTGSLAFGAVARIVYGTVKQPAEGSQEPPKMVLARAKSNIGPDGGGFVYATEQVELSEHSGIVATRIAWGPAVEGSASELLAESEIDDADMNDVDTFLSDLLERGPLPATEVYGESKSAGFSRDQMKRAKKRLRVKVVKTGMHGGWVWSLSNDEGCTEEGEGSTSNCPPPSRSSEGNSLPSRASAHSSE